MSDELWSLVEPLLPERGPKLVAGRPRVPVRQALCGILFVLHTGIQWEYLPQELGFGSGMTCWRRLAAWNEAGVWDQLHLILLARLRAAKQLDWSRAVIDSHVRAARRETALALNRAVEVMGRSRPFDRGRRVADMDAVTEVTPSSSSLQRPSPLTLPVVLTGVVLVAMSISGTAVALPSMGRNLDASGSALNWVIAGYNLAFAAMTLVAGSTADRVGRRRTFVASALVFSCGFLVTVVSPSMLFTDAARMVSGAGGAGIMAAGGAILAASYEGAARNRAFALMGTMAGVGIAVGPALSGLLVSATGWRGSFVVFTALGMLITVGATRMHESRAVTARADWAGSFLFVAALCPLMFVLLEAPSLGWADGAVVATAIAGVAALAVFGAVQRRSSHPVLESSLLTNRGFIGWSLATLAT